MRTLPSRPPSDAGYTLLELMTVLVLMGIALSLVAPSMTRFLEVERLRSATGRISGDLSLARTQAVRTGQSATFRIQNATTYVVTVPDASAAGGVRTVKRVSLADDFPGITISSSTPLNPTVVFNSRGLRSGGGASSEVVVTGPRASRKVTISPIGGIQREN